MRLGKDLRGTVEGETTPEMSWSTRAIYHEGLFFNDYFLDFCYNKFNFFMFLFVLTGDNINTMPSLIELFVRLPFFSQRRELIIDYTFYWRSPPLPCTRPFSTQPFFFCTIVVRALSISLVLFQNFILLASILSFNSFNNLISCLLDIAQISFSFMESKTHHSHPNTPRFPSFFLRFIRPSMHFQYSTIFQDRLFT